MKQIKLMQDKKYDSSHELWMKFQLTVEEMNGIDNVWRTTRR
jgi:hypothetical protein